MDFKLTLLLVSTATLIKLCCGLQEVTINEDLPLPESPEFSSVNVNHVLRWNYPAGEKYKDVTFDVEIGEMIFMYWTPEPQCQHITDTFCEVVSGVHRYDEGCPELNYSGEYGGRVRACITTEESGRQCTDWVESEKVLTLPQDDELSPPNFEIEGIFSGTQLRVINDPIVAKHLNKSLNCYYDNKLEYEIKYWGTNDTSQKLQESSASFEMENISLKLLQEPQSNSELCVEMRTVHKVKMFRSDWKKTCIIYERGDPGMDKVTLAVIITGGVAVFVVALIICAVKINKTYRYIYKTKFEIPHDLADLMNDSMNNVNTMPSVNLLKHVGYGENLTNSETTDSGSNVSELEGIVLDSNEIVYLLTPEAVTSSSVTGLSDIQETISSEDSTEEPVDNEHTVSYDSDCESTPYVRSVQDTDSNHDVTTEKDSNLTVNSFEVEPGHALDMRKLRGLSHSDSDLTRNVRRSKGATEHKTELSSLQKKELRLKPISNSSNYVDQIPHYTKACFERLPLREGMVAKTSDFYTTISEVMLTTEKIGTRWIRSIATSTDEKNATTPNNRADEDNCFKSYDVAESGNLNNKCEPVQKTPTDTTVALDNPTYNSKPVAFDFTDEVTNLCKDEKSSFRDHSYDNIRQMKKDHEKGRHLLNQRKTLYQRRRFRNRMPAVRQSGESEMNESIDSKIHPLKVSHMCQENTPYLKVTAAKRCHSCNSGSSTFSPMRDRIVSVDSGYQMGSFSVSDECCSLSPPISPDDTFYPEVFSSEGSPKMEQPKNHCYRNFNSIVSFKAKFDEYPTMLSETGSMGSSCSESDLHYVRENLEDISEDGARNLQKMRPDVRVLTTTTSDENIENYVRL